ncbi:MAG: hypothetical protein GWM98_06690 [Nitrospinaceae bacterium]|nr:hypothetical protein [Nitrospinaceae bacterium]NIR54241.1 hypothetical protein [Nitrospinaceae bacterium]NIS84658.1 hypothetical protein [Nitrospinaceae bacterium]NIT81453.1 hypothetical protein [Nitrospinaceae bacterium]NIU43736.1 hypothetical protein [Nitrospinaceae bacterium]
MVAQVRVEVEREGSYGDADGGRKWYVPQIMLRAPKKSKTRLVIKGFPLENIVQAHYVAQLIGAYTRAEALDFKGNPLPPLKTHIPTKFLAHQTDTMKSVASAMKNPQTQKPSAAAENPA